MDKTRPHPLFKLATELGPLLIFFFVNSKANLFVATGAFMVAVVIAMVASYMVTRHVPMMAIVTAVVVVVFGTLTLMVQEKQREVGILFAMGATRRSIVSVFVIEGWLIGLYGATVGLGLGYLVTFVFEHFGFRLNPEVYYIDRLPVAVNPMEFVFVGLVALGVCVVSTIFPAVLASRLRPVDALRLE